MTAFQPDDIVICVNDRMLYVGKQPATAASVERGRVYTVDRVVEYPSGEISLHMRCGAVGLARRFRKLCSCPVAVSNNKRLHESTFC